MTVLVDGPGGRQTITKGATEALLDLCTVVDFAGATVPFDGARREEARQTFERLSRAGYHLLAVAQQACGARPGPPRGRRRARPDPGRVRRLPRPARPRRRARRSRQLQGQRRGGEDPDRRRRAGHPDDLRSRSGIRRERDRARRRARAHVGRRAGGGGRADRRLRARLAGRRRTASSGRCKRKRPRGRLHRRRHQRRALAARGRRRASRSSNGVDVAKAAADIILLEKSLAAVQRGVVEGRRSFGNITKYVLMGTSSNFGNMLSMAVGRGVPALPAAAARADPAQQLPVRPLAAHHPDRQRGRELRRASPRKWDIGLIQRFMFGLGPISSLYDFLTFGVMLWVFHAGPGAVPRRLVHRVAGDPDAGDLRDPHRRQPVPQPAEPGAASSSPSSWVCSRSTSRVWAMTWPSSPERCVNSGSTSILASCPLARRSALATPSSSRCISRWKPSSRWPRQLSPASLAVERILASYLPGPVEVHEEVRKAFERGPVSHRSDAFTAEFRATEKLLCDLTSAARVEILLGSGSLANDAIGGQISLLGRRGMVLSNGEFGDRLIDHATAHRPGH